MVIDSYVFLYVFIDYYFVVCKFGVLGEDFVVDKIGKVFFEKLGG